MKREVICIKEFILQKDKSVYSNGFPKKDKIYKVDEETDGYYMFNRFNCTEPCGMITIHRWPKDGFVDITNLSKEIKESLSATNPDWKLKELSPEEKQYL